MSNATHPSHSPTNQSPTSAPIGVSTAGGPLIETAAELAAAAERGRGLPQLVRQLAEAVVGGPLGRAGRHGRRTYRAANRRMHHTWRDLEREPSASRRAGIAATLAEDAQLIAEVYTAAFGPDPIPGEDGRDMAQAAVTEAILLELLADTEILAHYQVELGQQIPWDVYCETNDVDVPWLAAQPHLQALCWTTTPAERADLVDLLAHDLLDQIGGQAAEVLTAAARAYRTLAQRTGPDQHAEPDEAAEPVEPVVLDGDAS